MEGKRLERIGAEERRKVVRRKWNGRERKDTQTFILVRFCCIC